MFYSKTWNAGDKFKITVQYNWKNGGNIGPSPDYTVQAYSLQTLTIYDKAVGETDRLSNKINMDGTCPSGLVGTKLNYCTNVHPADKPAPMKRIEYIFLSDLFEHAAWDTFFYTLFSNPKILLPIYWFDWFGMLIGSPE